MTLFLGLDIGTTSTIGILIDAEGGIRATASRPSDLVSRHANWAEEDPAQWWDNCRAIVGELIDAAGVPPEAIAGVGVTGMVPAIVLLDVEGNVLRHSIQQNDARAVEEIDAMRAAFDADRFFALTGGSINQQLVAPKLRWLQRHEPSVLERARTVFGSYDYITYRLTGRRIIEHNWALESGLMSIETGAFEPELVEAAGIEYSRLPPIRASHEIVGEVTAEAAAATGLAAGTPVVAGCADHVASAYVAGAASNGDLVLKFGGAGDILLSVDQPLTDPRLFIDYHITPGLYFSNGCMAASCSVLNWIVREMAGGLGDAAARAGKSIHALLDDRAAAVAPGGEGVLLLPYFLGEKTPLHDPQARGTLVGVGLHHGLQHVWRAALEGVIFGFRHHVEVWRERGVEIGRVFACDGGAVSDLWLQIAADALARPVQRIDRHPGSCLGAAFVAGYAVGAFEDLAGVARYVGAGRVFEPDAARVAAYDQIYPTYRELYDRLRTFYPKLEHGGAE